METYQCLSGLTNGTYKLTAWSGHTCSQLRTDVYHHAYDVLKAQGTTADMVQVGNEINGGMLWNEGSTSNRSQLAGLLTSGHDAVRAVNSGTAVAITSPRAATSRAPAGGSTAPCPTV